MPKPHQANWLPRLAERLEASGVPTAIPAFPEPYAPKYSRWRATFEQYTVTEHTGIVGFSAGGEFLLRWLTENPEVVIKRAVLVAPWHDESHEYGKDFFDYTLDPGVSERVGRLTVFNSTDDGAAIQKSVAMIRRTLPDVHYRKFEGYGHFMIGNNMTGPEFPELFDELHA